MNYKLETIGEDTIVTSDTGRKYILAEAISTGNRRVTYDLTVIFEWVEYNPKEEPGAMWFGKYVNYCMGACTYCDDEEELLDSVRPFIDEYEKNIAKSE